MLIGSNTNTAILTTPNIFTFLFLCLRWRLSGKGILFSGCRYVRPCGWCVCDYTLEVCEQNMKIECDNFFKCYNLRASEYKDELFTCIF